jgi:hypothetical protein
MNAALAESSPILQTGSPGTLTRIGVRALYMLLLLGLSIHLYRSPYYDMDFVQYMGNALLMEEPNPVRLHARIYTELRQRVPGSALQGLLGNEPGAPEDQNRSRRERATDPDRYMQFLPLFAIRPMYNQTLWLVSKTGLGLVRSGVLISVASFYGLGILLFAWLRHYLHPIFTLVVSFLTMLSPPLVQLGRDTTSDALASVIAFSSLYLIFEKRRMLPGLILLLASLYFRTDFVVLAGPVLLACWLQKRIEFWKASVLAILALLSVLTINHFAGDYGIKMLYYRNFVGVPIAPGEMVIHFTFRDYLSAFRSGITLATGSFFLPFLLLGTFGLAFSQARAIYAVTLSYVLLHFLVLPNWQERWVGIFYLTMVVCAAIPRSRSEQSGSIGWASYLAA